MSDVIPQAMRAEFMDWIVYLMIESDMMRAQLGAVVRIDGRIDAARLARAVRLLMDAEPVLGCRFVAEGQPPHWQRQGNLDDLVTVRVRETADAEAAATAYVAAGMDRRAAPQVRVEVFRAPDGDTLALKVNHTAVDGGGTKQVLYLMGSIYRALAADPAFVPAPDSDSPRDLGALAKRATLLERLRAVRVRNHFPPTDWSVPGSGGEGEPVYIAATIESDEFEPIVLFGKRHDATVHDLLLTAYYRALFAELGPRPGARTPVNMSADLRAWLPPDTRIALANLPATWAITVSPKEGEDFEGTLARVVERTREWKDADVGRIRAVEGVVADRLVRWIGMDTLRRHWAQITRRFEGTGYPSLTNLGVIDDRSLDFGADCPVADAFLLGPIGHPGGFILTVSTFRRRFRLSAGIDALATDAGLARRVVERTAAELRSTEAVS
ncbi:MAG TPA: hypothetical protein VF902_00510 [Coriobacteriia bacterium]